MYVANVHNSENTRNFRLQVLHDSLIDFDDKSYLCKHYHIISEMDKLQSLWQYITSHKYMITIIVFVIFVLFFDKHSVVKRIQSAREIYHLKSEIERYHNEYNENTRKLNELEDNPEAIENIAREKYLMKRENEDIYVFED